MHNPSTEEAEVSPFQLKIDTEDGMTLITTEIPALTLYSGNTYLELRTTLTIQNEKEGKSSSFD